MWKISNFHIFGFLGSKKSTLIFQPNMLFGSIWTHLALKSSQKSRPKPPVGGKQVRQVTGEGSMQNLLRFYSDSTQILLRFYSDSTQVLLRFYSDSNNADLFSANGWLRTRLLR